MCEYESTGDRLFAEDEELGEHHPQSWGQPEMSCRAITLQRGDMLYVPRGTPLLRDSAIGSVQSAPEVVFQLHVGGFTWADLLLVHVQHPNMAAQFVEDTLNLDLVFEDALNTTLAGAWSWQTMLGPLVQSLGKAADAQGNLARQAFPLHLVMTYHETDYTGISERLASPELAPLRDHFSILVQNAAAACHRSLARVVRRLLTSQMQIDDVESMERVAADAGRCAPGSGIWPWRHLLYGARPPGAHGILLE